MDATVNKHWVSYRDDRNIAWLSLDVVDASANILKAEVLEALFALLQMLHKDASLNGIVIQSGKKEGFIAGADIEQFKNMETPEEALHAVQQGQKVIQFLSNFSCPTLALIQGYCLGGGLELALACRYRVAIDDPKTQLGLPEVKLGIHPGWGGTVRLPRLIGGLKAMEFIISGRTVTAMAAYKMGMVDAVVPERQGKSAVNDFLLKRPKAHRPTVWGITNFGIIRSLLGKWLQKQLAAKVNRQHYPAPFAVIEHWMQHGVSDDQAFIEEGKSIAELMVTDTARNLVKVFFLQEKLKSLGKINRTVFKQVHVEGAGVMGGDIAAWCALHGMRVTLHDPNEKAIALALSRARVLFHKQLKEPHRIQTAMDRLLPDTQGLGVKKADLIIEAIVEKADAKKALFTKLAREAREEAVFATNTSTIPLDQLTDDAQVQKRLIGLHFFNPVVKMPLVEVVGDVFTDKAILEKGLAFVRSIHKLPLPVKSAPGFLVNRILMPYLLEAVALLDTGLSAYQIDEAAKCFGMPMGPLELADTIGLDVCLDAAESLVPHFGGTIPRRLRAQVEAGNLGKKNEQGFYQYKKGTSIPKKQEKESVQSDIIDKLMAPMVESALACLKEQIVPDAEYLDAAMIFGAGFPPFRGGLMQYAGMRE